MAVFASRRDCIRNAALCDWTKLKITSRPRFPTMGTRMSLRKFHVLCQPRRICERFAHQQEGRGCPSLQLGLLPMKCHFHIRHSSGEPLEWRCFTSGPIGQLRYSVKEVKRKPNPDATAEPLSSAGSRAAQPRFPPIQRPPRGGAGVVVKCRALRYSARFERYGGMAGDHSRSLGKGSAAPGPVPDGVIRLYSMRFCPFAQRTRLVLRAKGIRHEVININLKNKPDWLFEKNPSGLIPILETSKGQLIYESPITCEYLDEAFPGRKLMPSDPYERAFQKMLLERFSKITTVISKALKEGDDLTTLKAELAEKFAKLDEILSQRNTVFYGGDSSSLIDYMIWPWFERLEAFQLKDVLTHTPKLQHWMEAMKKDPAVKDTITDTQTLRVFLQLYFKNSPEACDYGL